MRKKLTFLLIAILASLGAMAQDVVEISTVDQLKAFRDAVNSGDTYAGKTVKLTADLDLSSENNWVPIGNLVAYPGQSFNGVFDGGGHSISNLTCTDNTPQYAVAGLFGSIVSGTIKDLTVKNVNIKSTHYAAGIVAYTSNTPTIENCHVIGGTISSTPEIVNGSYDNGDKVGGIMGYATAGSTINNCTVQDVTITAYRDIGGIVGYSAGNVTNNTVIDVTVKQDLTNGYKNPTPTTVGDIVGGGTAVNFWESNNNKVLKSVAKIGDTKYTTLAAAEAAASEGDKIEIIQPGNYNLPNISKNVTIEGIVDGIVFNHSSGNIASVPNGATFKNLTFNFGSVDYHGFYEAGTINMEGCTLNGKLFSYGDMNFTDCAFNHSGDYNMWCYGPSVVKYTGCTFTNTGKFLNVYREGAEKNTVYVENCKFINTGDKNKAALNVKATSSGNLLTADVYIKNCTTEGAFPVKGDLCYDKGVETGIVVDPLAQVDDRTADGVDNIRVWKDDVQIYPLKPVAKIGEVGYPTLQSAVDAAYKMTGDVTIKLVDDITEYAIVLQKAGLNLTIDGKDGETNHTIKGQIVIDGAGNLDNTETLVISNLNFEGNKDDFSGNSDAFILIPSPKDLGKPWHYTNTTNKDHFNYAHNITVSNCSFVSTSENSKGYDVVGVKVAVQQRRPFGDSIDQPVQGLLLLGGQETGLLDILPVQFLCRREPPRGEGSAVNLLQQPGILPGQIVKPVHMGGEIRRKRIGIGHFINDPIPVVYLNDVIGNDCGNAGQKYAFGILALPPDHVEADAAVKDLDDHVLPQLVDRPHRAAGKQLVLVDRDLPEGLLHLQHIGKARHFEDLVNIPGNIHTPDLISFFLDLQHLPQPDAGKILQLPAVNAKGAVRSLLQCFHDRIKPTFRLRVVQFSLQRDVQ